MQGRDSDSGAGGSSMTTEAVCVLNRQEEEEEEEEEEEDTALGYYDDEDDLEAFSDAGLGCEDGGRRVFLVLGKVTEQHRAVLWAQCARAPAAAPLK